MYENIAGHQRMRQRPSTDMSSNINDYNRLIRTCVNQTKVKQRQKQTEDGYPLQILIPSTLIYIQ